MRSIFLFAALTLAIGVAVARYADKIMSQPDNPPASSAVAISSSSSSQPQLPTIVNMSRSVTLRGDGLGHFKAEARVDGRRVDFMVDTGASIIVLRASTAAQLGFHPAARDYTVKLQTANGIISAAPVRLNIVELDGIIVRDVPAVVQPDETLQVNLLGMTFLSRVRWTHDRGKLVLEQ